VQEKAESEAGKIAWPLWKCCEKG